MVTPFISDLGYSLAFTFIRMPATLEQHIKRKENRERERTKENKNDALDHTDEKRIEKRMYILTPPSLRQMSAPSAHRQKPNKTK